MNTNISHADHPEEQISRLLTVIGQPARIQILFIIAGQEACVCHLEAVLGMRQASISQHLMVLRKAGLVTANRDGRNIFYRLADPKVVELLCQVAELTGTCADALISSARIPVPGCPCPQCNPGIDPALTCRSVQPGRK